MGAAGARRPAAGHRRHTTYFIYSLPADFDVLPFNNAAQYRQTFLTSSTNFLVINNIFSTTSSNFHDHQQHLLDNFIKLFHDHQHLHQTFMIINKLSRQHQQTFSTTSSNFLDNFVKLFHDHQHLLDIITLFSHSNRPIFYLFTPHFHLL